MNSSDLSQLAWRKSTRSAEQGGTCVEVATWHKSSRSADQGGACVEVAALLDERLTLVRDSKNPDGAVLSFTGPAWASFTQ
ncbi:MAG: toxin, partial [Actinomycetia bacterium]|nr:toxin [Actinomycetes bacterium]